MGISKSKQKSQSESKNLAYPFLQEQLGGTVGYAGQGAQGISALLGGDASGFDAFKRATGFDRTLASGMQDITGAGAARGLLRSGATGRNLVNYGQELQNQTAQNYIQNLLGLGGLGLGAANTIGSAGQVSSATSKQKSKGLQGPSFKPW